MRVIARLLAGAAIPVVLGGLAVLGWSFGVSQGHTPAAATESTPVPASPSASPSPTAAPTGSASPAPTPTASRVPSASPTPSPAPSRTATLSGTRSDRTRLRLRTTITGDIAPKSVRSSGTGLVSAHNMMYRHSVTLYDASRMRLLATVPDRVRLSSLGFPEYREPVSGAPVEGAFAPDGRHLYVSNYSMYGPGFQREGSDVCRPSDPIDESFVYRIRLRDRRIDAAYPVGRVPKAVEVTPDGRYLLVSNWCSWDVSVIDLDLGTTVRRLPVGAYPRGIAVSSDSRAAYVAVMGGTTIERIDLRTWERRSIRVGLGPRTVVLSPDGTRLYVTLNAEGRVVAVDLPRRRVVGSVATGTAPRSMDIAADGASLYVVNYLDDTLSKISTDTMTVTQSLTTCERPIGVAYESTEDRVWVACYSGMIEVYDNR